MYADQVFSPTSGAKNVSGASIGIKGPGHRSGLSYETSDATAYRFRSPSRSRQELASIHGMILYSERFRNKVGYHVVGFGSRDRISGEIPNFKGTVFKNADLAALVGGALNLRKHAEVSRNETVECRQEGASYLKPSSLLVDMVARDMLSRANWCTRAARVFSEKLYSKDVEDDVDEEAEEYLESLGDFSWLLELEKADVDRAAKSLIVDGVYGALATHSRAHQNFGLFSELEVLDFDGQFSPKFSEMLEYRMSLSPRVISGVFSLLAKEFRASVIAGHVPYEWGKLILDPDGNVVLASNE